MSYNIAIVGSRNFNDKELFEKVMSEVLLIEGKPNKVISGGAVGADTLAYEWAIENKIEIVIFKPRHGDFPKKSRNWMAPKERNTRIVENSEIVLAFWDMSSTGTKDTIEKAIKNNRKIYIFNLLDYSLITENIV
ncbi:MAG: DUF2493 domain-containing protein [Bacteroidetes bacterium]|nr:DUF2493 domain-containing protein [Bacteroidota bacterium]